MKKVIYKPFIMPILLALCTLFYYFGELIDWAAWDVLRNNFFYSIHDIHRLFFLIPIIYAGYNARIKGAVIVTLISFVIFLPRAFFISPYLDPLLRMALFTVFAGVIGVLIGSIRNQAERSNQLEVLIARERDRLLKIVDGMADGIIITGSDYRIRFMNANMVDAVGQGTGFTCYQHLQKVDTPCRQDCKILDVINNEEIRHWECAFPDGRIYEILAAPYVDTDGTACQISLFRDTSQRKNV